MSKTRKNYGKTLLDAIFDRLYHGGYLVEDNGAWSENSRGALKKQLAKRFKNVKDIIKHWKFLGFIENIDEGLYRFPKHEAVKIDKEKDVGLLATTIDGHKGKVEEVLKVDAENINSVRVPNRTIGETIYKVDGVWEKENSILKLEEMK